MNSSHPSPRREIDEGSDPQAATTTPGPEKPPTLYVFQHRNFGSQSDRVRDNTHVVGPLVQDIGDNCEAKKTDANGNPDVRSDGRIYINSQCSDLIALFLIC